MSGRGIAALVGALALSGTLLLAAGSALGAGSSAAGGLPFGLRMMRGTGMMGGWSPRVAAAGPGDPGFVAGTNASPRVIRVVAGPGYAFSPSSIRVARGETVTFAVTTMGPLVHEFMVGPAADVAVERDGTPEVADIGMMQTKTLTYTFDGSGPYSYACHAPGHFEAGMRGAIEIVG